MSDLLVKPGQWNSFSSSAVESFLAAMSILLGLTPKRKAFIEQINLANKLDLPIVIHTREAIMDTLTILKEHKVTNKGVFHCCPLNRELVKEALKLGFYISFAGPVTFKNSKNANEIIELVPNDKILIETDSPYLSPEPFRGKRNDPTNVKLVAK